MEAITYHSDQQFLTAPPFLRLVNRVWPGKYEEQRAAEALEKTINLTAWQGDELIGCVRLLTDGYFFSTITEILVDPAFQGRGIGTRLMEMVFEVSPTSLSFGVQPGNEPFFSGLGFEKGLDSYQKRKDRNG